jgi:hypothetical protein
MPMYGNHRVSFSPPIAIVKPNQLMHTGAPCVAMAISGVM